ncbi:MAG: hypothetical protein ACM3SS_00730 [Rhodospirillaceae bacterium]
MPNIFEKLGIAEDAGVEEIARAIIYNHTEDTLAGYFATVIQLLAALCARERADVWGQMSNECQYLTSMDKCGRALIPHKQCDYATCPLINAPNEKGEANG